MEENNGLIKEKQRNFIRKEIKIEELVNSINDQNLKDNIKNAMALSDFGSRKNSLEKINLELQCEYTNIKNEMDKYNNLKEEQETFNKIIDDNYDWVKANYRVSFEHYNHGNPLIKSDFANQQESIKQALFPKYPSNSFNTVEKDNEKMEQLLSILNTIENS